MVSSGSVIAFLWFFCLFFPVTFHCNLDAASWTVRAAVRSDSWQPEESANQPSPPVNQIRGSQLPTKILSVTPRTQLLTLASRGPSRFPPSCVAVSVAFPIVIPQGCFVRGMTARQSVIRSPVSRKGDSISDDNPLGIRWKRR